MWPNGKFETATTTLSGSTYTIWQRIVF
jgi:hypothetical protein